MMGDDAGSRRDSAPQRLTEEITQQAMAQPRALAGRALLIRQDGEPEELEIRDREVIVGSAVDSDMWVDDPTVSRHHLAIRRDGLAYLIRDLGSTNGTYVDGVRIKEVYLRPGSRVQAGRLDFRFEVTPPKD